MRGHVGVRLVVAVSSAACAWISAVAATPPEDLGTLMTQVGQRVAGYYERAHSVICVERSTVQPIGFNWGPEGMPRTVESDLRVEYEGQDGSPLPEAKVSRDIRRINGRAPRERDKKDRSGCTDPNPLSPEPLSFLLSTHKDEYRFTSVRDGREKDRPALIIDFLSADRTSKPELIEDERGHDDCFDWTGPVATKGRVWIDALTYDVLRVERRIGGPVSVKVPWALQRRYNFDSWVSVERDDVTMRYQSVAFTDPDEAIMLPASIESLTVVHGGLQSIRRVETYSDYRRFVTSARVIKNH
jgi:hypothetical protein